MSLEACVTTHLYRLLSFFFPSPLTDKNMKVLLRLCSQPTVLNWHFLINILHIEFHNTAPNRTAVTDSPCRYTDIQWIYSSIGVVKGQAGGDRRTNNYKMDNKSNSSSKTYGCRHPHSNDLGIFFRFGRTFAEVFTFGRASAHEV